MNNQDIAPHSDPQPEQPAPPAAHPDPQLLSPMNGKTAALPGGSFVVAEWTAEVTEQRMLIAPLHVHHHDEEAWYVLEGTLGFRLGSQEVQAAAGTGVFVPGGVPHTYWNAGSIPGRYLLIMTPRIHQLIQAIHALQERTPEALSALFQAHDSELL